MTAPLDPIIASARIVTPEEAALDRAELAQMKIMLGLARMTGAPAHVVQFADGVAAIVVGNLEDAEAWQALLAKTHAAAVAGIIGPIDEAAPS